MNFEMIFTALIMIFGLLSMMMMFVLVVLGMRK